MEICVGVAHNTPEIIVVEGIVGFGPGSFEKIGLEVGMIGGESCPEG